MNTLSPVRRECRHNHLICNLIIALSFPIAAFAQVDSIPKNQYGLPVITSTRQYKQSAKSHSSKRMVAVKKYVKPLETEWKYATTNNFTNKVLYKNPAAYLRKDAAEALQKVQAELLPQQIGVKIFDAYRPYSVTEQMWKIVPDTRYAANPAKGSGHNRGAAVDITLIDLATLKELPMPTPFDDFTEKAHHNYMDLPADILKNRALLRTTMEKFGFIALDTEWWHYYLPNAAQNFELMDLSFRQMKRMARRKNF